MFDHGERKECSPLSNLCEKGEWCHVGSSPETTACCPGAIADPCKLELDAGEGAENLTRWFSDPSDRSCNNQCRPFAYRGTKGNQNNFLSKEACEAACRSECGLEFGLSLPSFCTRTVCSHFFRSPKRHLLVSRRL